MDGYSGGSNNRLLPPHVETGAWSATTILSAYSHVRRIDAQISDPTRSTTLDK